LLIDGQVDLSIMRSSYKLHVKNSDILIRVLLRVSVPLSELKIKFRTLTQEQKNSLLYI